MKDCIQYQPKRLERRVLLPNQGICAKMRMRAGPAYCFYELYYNVKEAHRSKSLPGRRCHIIVHSALPQRKALMSWAQTWLWQAWSELSAFAFSQASLFAICLILVLMC